MKKFRYAMQNILNIKYRLEDQAKGEYAAAQAVLNAEVRKLDLIYEQIREYENSLKQLVSGKLDFQEIIFTENAVELKKNEAKEQKKKVLAANKAVEIARQKLNEIMIDRKTHERLKDKAFEQYMLEYNKEEALAVDELVSYRHNNKDE